MAQIKKIWFNEDRIFAVLKDGRTVDVPVNWFPNLSKGNPQQLDNYEIWGDKQCIHWPDLDEDISAETLVSLHPRATGRGIVQWSLIN